MKEPHQKEKVRDFLIKIDKNNYNRSKLIKRMNNWNPFL